MNIQALAHVLKATCSGTEVRQAQAQLDAYYLTHPDYAVALLNLCGLESASSFGIDDQSLIMIKQAAALQFKNFIGNYWHRKSSSSSKNDESKEKPKLSEQSRNIIMENLVGVIMIQPFGARIQLVLALQCIASESYPKKWPNLTGKLIEYIKTSENYSVLQGTLLILRFLTKNFEYYSDKDTERTHMNTLVKQMFPYLEGLMVKLLNSGNSNESFDLVKLILKTFWSATQMTVPAYLRQPPVLDKWMCFLFHILAVPVSVEDPKYVGWKIKKWVGTIFTRWLNKYGTPKDQTTKPFKKFAKIFQKEYSQRAISGFLQLLAMKQQGMYIPPRIVQLVFYLLSIAIHYGTTYSLIKPNLESIICNCLFPLLCFSDEDLVLWKEDPHEYIRREFDLDEEFYTPKNAAINFLVDLVKWRGKQNIPMIVAFIQDILQKYTVGTPAQASNCRNLDGVFIILGSLAGKLRRTEPYCSQLETLLVKHVFPQLGCEVGILRSRACWLFGKFSKHRFINIQAYSSAISACLNLLNDDELAVRVFAGIAIKYLVQSKLGTEIIRPHLPQLMQTLARVMNQVDSDDLVMSLEVIVEVFEDDMEPHAAFLCMHLTQSFVRIAGSGSDLDDSAALAAKGCLQAINTLLEVLRKAPSMFPKMEVILLPLLIEAFHGSSFSEFIDDFLQMITYLTFFNRQISPNTWPLFPLLYKLFDGWALDYAEYILPPLDNFISYGTEVFLSDPQYLEMIFAIYKKLLDASEDETSGIMESESGKGCQLVESVLQHCKGAVDSFAVNCVILSLNRLKTAMTKGLQVLLMEVVLNAINYNVKLTLSVLESQKSTQNFFTFWFTSFRLLRRIYDKKLSIIALSWILHIPLKELPEIVLNGLKDIVINSLKLLRFLEVQRQEAEEAGKEFESDDCSDSDIEEDDEEDGDDSESEEEWTLGHDFADDEDIQLSDDEDNDRAYTVGSKQVDICDYEDEEDEEDLDDIIDEDFESPLDSVNEVTFFVESLNFFKSQDPVNFDRLINMIPRREQQLLKRWNDIALKMIEKEKNEHNH